MLSRRAKKLLRLIVPEERWPQMILLCIIVGVGIGALVAGFEFLAEEILLDELLQLPLWVKIPAPLVGLILTWVILRVVGGKKAEPGTSDEFIKEVHERTPSLPIRHLPAKILGGITTIGFGGALGLEGPSMYSGSSMGYNLSSSFKWFNRKERKMMMLAGAAAGIAAIFKAPATGVVFALESPYRRSTNQGSLLPALLASASSFVMFTLILGTDPVFGSLGSEPNSLDTSHLLGAVIIGIAAGLGGRGYSWLALIAKRVRNRLALLWQLLISGMVLGLLVLVTDIVFGEALSLGPGQEAINWLIEEQRGLWLIAALFAIRIGATLITLLGGGTGGLFIPLAVQGLIVGVFVANLFGGGEVGSSFYPILGLSAFLGAGYGTPLAAVMFVAEFTRGSLFVVPALVAAAMSQVVVGRFSVSSYKAAEQVGHLERRLTLPISSALTTDVLSVPTDATVSEFVYNHVMGLRHTEVPILQNGKYMGMCRLEDVSGVERSDWENTLVSEIAAPEVPVGHPSWNIKDALIALDNTKSEVLPIVDSEGNFVGLVYEQDLTKLGEILEETED